MQPGSRNFNLFLYFRRLFFSQRAYFVLFCFFYENSIISEAKSFWHFHLALLNRLFCFSFESPTQPKLGRPLRWCWLESSGFSLWTKHRENIPNGNSASPVMPFFTSPLLLSSRNSGVLYPTGWTIRWRFNPAFSKASLMAAIAFRHTSGPQKQLTPMISAPRTNSKGMVAWIEPPGMSHMKCHFNEANLYERPQ